MDVVSNSEFTVEFPGYSDQFTHRVVKASAPNLYKVEFGVPDSVNHNIAPMDVYLYNPKLEVREKISLQFSDGEKRDFEAEEDEPRAPIDDKRPSKPASGRGGETRAEEAAQEGFLTGTTALVILGLTICLVYVYLFKSGAGSGVKGRGGNYDNRYSYNRGDERVYKRRGEQRANNRGF